MTATLANGGNANRRELDFYPTPPDATHAVAQFMQIKGYLNRGSIVWEPACGDGAMSEVLSQYADYVRSSDLRESGFGESGKDFLLQSFDCDVVITNPPFSASSEFIIHGLKQAPIVAMLLKSQYWHAKKRIQLFDAHPPAWVLPLTWRPDFMSGERGGAPTMDVHWTVWIGNDTDTKYRLLKKPSPLIHAGATP